MKFQRPLCQRVEQLHTFLCAGMQEVRIRTVGYKWLKCSP